jgi:hypothetical protein
MVQKLTESFDVDAGLLVRFSKFNLITLIVLTTFGEVNEQLENIKANLGINQGWNADLEEDAGTRVDVVLHQEALTMTLCNCIEDMEDATRSGSSCQSDFSPLIGISTNNSKATVRQHTLQGKASKNIELINKNYTLENTLLDTRAQISAIIAQNKLLQDQLSSLNQEFNATAPLPSIDNNMAHDDIPLPICGGGGTSCCHLPTVEDIPVPCRHDESQELMPTVHTYPDFLLPGVVYVPFPSSSGKSTDMYYLCPGRMSEHDQVQPVPDFNPKTQEQVLDTIWRPTMQTFQIILKTIPRATLCQAQSQRRKSYCSEQIVDVNRQCLHFALKAVLMRYITHHQTMQQERLKASQPC